MKTTYRSICAAVTALLAASALTAGCSKSQTSARDATTPAAVDSTSDHAVQAPAGGASASPGAPASGAPGGSADVTKIPTPDGDFTLQGAILKKFDAVGGANSPLGLPTSNEQPGPNGGRYSTFDGGAIYWTPQTGAHVIWGGIRNSWNGDGGAGGPLGYPTTDEQTIPGEGWQQSFQHGVITYTDGPHIQKR